MNRAQTEITAELARAMLSYDKDSGEFRWRINWNRMRAGQRAGSVSHGYIRINLFGNHCYAQRLAFLVVTGAWPTHTVDHINGNRSDNRWKNLRDIEHHANIQNRVRPNKGSRTGLLGISKSSANRWEARIFVMGQPHHLGFFETPEFAHGAYRAAKRRLHEGNTL